jgi:hypothetical protein
VNNLTKGKSKLIIILTNKISQQSENCENRNDPDFLIRSLKKFIFRYQDLVEIYSVSAETIISDAFSYSEMYKDKEVKNIFKLPNCEQSYKGKVKTHNYINRQNQSTIGKL